MAKKTIANLNIQLSAGSATLRQDLQKVSASVQGFGSDVMGMATKIGGALAGAFAVSRITAGIRGQMEAIDEIAKTADQIGASVADVQALNMAADLAGVGVSELAGGFRKMSSTIADAANGSETAAAALARVGLSAQELAGKSPVQQLAAIIEALQGVGDATERMALAQDLLGKGGQAFLSLDSAQIRAAADDVERLGLAMTRADAAKVEEANDAITRMTASVQGLYQKLAIALAPVITQVAEGITSMVAVIGNLDATTVTNTAKLIAFAAAFGGVLILIPRIVAGVRSIILTLQALASAQAITAALSGPAGWAKLAVAAGVAAVGVAGVSKAFDGVTKSADKAAAKATDAGSKTKKAMQDAAAGVSEVAAAMDNMVPEMDAAAQAWWDGRSGSVEALQRQAKQVSDQMATPAEKFEKQMADLQQMWDQRLITPEVFEMAGARYREEMENALNTQEKISNLQQVGTRSIGAVQAGTSAAFTAVQTASREQREQLAAAKAQVQMAKYANEALKQIVTNTGAAKQTVERIEIK